MRWIERPGYRLAVEAHGPGGGPACVLSHSLGADRRMWAPQVAALARDVHLITYDHPGHGDSTRPVQIGDIADFGEDALAVADACGLDRFVFAGVSLGGMVGLWLAAHAGDRLRHLLAANTAARIPDTTLLRGRIDLLRCEPVSAIADNVIARWLTPDFAAAHPDLEGLCRDMLDRCGAATYADTAEQICRLDLWPVLSRIACPCSVLVGEYDLATPATWGRAIAAAIPGAACQSLPVAHLSNLQAPEVFNACILEACR